MVKLSDKHIEKIEMLLNKNAKKEIVLKIEDGEVVILSVVRKKL